MGQFFVAIGIGLVTVLIALWAWVRPLYQQALKAQENAEAAEKRIQHEMELQRNEILLEAKEAALQIRQQAEAEAKEKLASAARSEERLCTKDEALELRRTQIEDREGNLSKESRLLTEREISISGRIKAIDDEMQRISCLNKEEARDLYLKQIESEFSEIGLRRAKEVEAQAVLDAEKRAKKVVLDVMQRSVVDYVTEATLAVVELPSEDMKGRDRKSTR